METMFVCPRTKEMLTEAVCEANYEYEACMGCTSQQDTARKALYDTLAQKYGIQMSVTMEKNEVRLAVREDVNLLVDAGDWREATYAEIDCGRYGRTHTHPSDVLQWVEDFLAGHIVILLEEGNLSSIMLEGEERRWWSYWHESTWAVDASGIYPAEEYAKAKGFMGR